MNLVSNELVRVKLPRTVKTLQSLSMFHALELHHLKVIQDTRSESDGNRWTQSDHVVRIRVCLFYEKSVQLKGSRFVADSEN